VFEKRVEAMDMDEDEAERCMKVQPRKVSGWRQRGKDGPKKGWIQLLLAFLNV